MNIGDYVAYFFLWPLFILILAGVWWTERRKDEPPAMTALEAARAKRSRKGLRQSCRLDGRKHETRTLGTSARGQRRTSGRG
jgi:hypothetical protein